MQNYIEEHSTPPDEWLHELWRATHLHLLRPRMASGPVQGQLLRMLMQMIRPQTVVEIGTYSGYSALAMASGMEKNSRLITFEVNDEQEVFTRPWLENAPYAVRPEMFIGDVFQLLPPMNLSIDVAFIDADKRQSSSYILADNTLWDGHVIETSYDCDPQTRGIKAFNDLVAEDPDVEQVILSERDGLSVIRVK